MVLGDSWCSMVPRCLLSPLGSLLLFGVLAHVELLAYYRYSWLTVSTVRMLIYVLGELASAPAAYWEASGSVAGKYFWRASWGTSLGSLLGSLLGSCSGEAYWGIANRLSILFPGAYNS